MLKPYRSLILLSLLRCVLSTNEPNQAFPPIAAPPGGVTDGIDPDEDDLILEDSDQDLSEFLGKELDLFFEPSAVLSAPSAAAAAYHSGGVRSSHAYEAGGGGSGAATSARGRHVGVPSERTSYIFCPEAHGMMRYAFAGEQ